jgi:hypothetical protein
MWRAGNDEQRDGRLKTWQRANRVLVAPVLNLPMNAGAGGSQAGDPAETQEEPCRARCG